MYLLWLDFESNGVTSDCDVLEVAAVVTINRAPFPELARYESIVMPAPGWRERANPIALAMAVDSGLAAAIEGESGDLFPHLGEAEVRLVDMMVGICATPGDWMLAGSGIRFDRGVIEAQLPEVEKLLYYRQLDISPIRTGLELVERDDLMAGVPKASKAHRAMADVEDHLAEWRAYAKMFAAIPR